MKKQTKYTKAPAKIATAITMSKAVTDLLPEPQKLAAKEASLKVTLLLTKNSVDFFKREAKALGYPYQKMIKNVIDIYAKHYQKEKHINTAKKHC